MNTPQNQQDGREEVDAALRRLKAQRAGAGKAEQNEIDAQLIALAKRGLITEAQCNEARGIEIEIPERGSEKRD